MATLLTIHCCLQEAEEKDKLHILSVDLASGALLEDFHNALIEDFGTVDDYVELKESKLYVGPFGITGMIEKVFDPVINELLLDHPLYDSLFALFSTMAGILARRLSNYKKVCVLYFPSS